MSKRFIPILLVLALLLCGAVNLGEQLPSLSTARINELQELAGENGAQWIEGTPPSPDMNAFQMWQWTDWFLSNRVRSLLGTIQDYEQLEPDVPLHAQAEEDQWQLRETENILSRFEAQLEEDRLAILNGIRLYQSDETSDTGRLTVCKRILEAESEIRQIIRTICADYDTYLASVDNCYRGLQANYGGYTLDVHDNTFNSLLQSAETLENSENAATSDFSVSVISTYQFRIRVCAPDQKPIENATVTVTSRLNETQKQTPTDAQGDAVFWVGELGADEKGELLLNLRIEAAGYRTREVQTVCLRRGETRSFDLQKDDGTPYLIMGCFNGKDILTESNSYYCSQENTANHTFTVKLHCDTDGELELRYSVDAEATEYRTVVKKFSAADSDKTVLEFKDQWLSKLLPGAKVSFTIKADGKQYTTDTLLIIQKAMVEKPILNTQWNKTLWEGKLDLSQNSAIAPTGEEYKHFDNTGAQIPLPPTENSITYGSSGVEPIETKQVFSQIDSAAGDFQYVVIGGDTYLFWIQPGTEKGQARLNWYNLTDMSQHGEVTWLEGATGHRRSLADYDFAVEVSRGLDNQTSSFCALTILSGQFSGTGSGESAEAPDQSILTTVLMKQNDKTKGLEIVCYQEHERVFMKDNYAVMPEVFLTASGDNTKSVYLVSTCTSSSDRRYIYGQIVYTQDPSSQTSLDGLAVLDQNAFEDEDSITRYHVGIPSSANNVNVYSLNEAGELSRLYFSGTSSKRDLLAQGNIINFRVYTQLEGSNAKDRLFYLDQVEQEDGTYIQRLKCVTLDLMNSSAAPVITDYGVEINTDHFDIVKFGSGVYLYWTECSTPNGSSDSEKEYLVRCVRYDPGTDTVYGPFSLVELGECPNSIKLQDSGTGFYSVDLQSSQGSYLRQSLSRFTFGSISSAGMTAAALSDPCVSAGDYTELMFSVKNTGNVPLSAFDVEIIDTETDALVQTLHIDLDNPELSTNNYCFHGETYTITGKNALRRISSMYDPLNQEEWTITDTTAAGRTVRSVRTDLLMPGDTHSYQTKIQIPADWKGGNTLIAQIVDVTGEPALNSRQTADGLLLIGAPQTGNTPAVRLGSEATKGIDTDAHDLMLSAQLFQRSGEDYVHITIRNRSGNTSSFVTPVLTSTFRGEALFSHPFVNAMGDEFGYSMDIPLKTLTNGQCPPELDLYVSNADYEDFADSDNHVRLLLTVQMCIIDQPVSITATKGDEAVFSVTAAGGEKPYRYQWQRMTGVDQWENIPGADQDTYRIASVQPEQNGLTVRCVITDQLGDSVTSDPAALSVQLRNSVTSDPAAPSVLPQIVQLCIVDQPVNISASEGEEAMFSVTADGGEKPYRYQWQCMSGIDQWTDIPGADQDTYRIASVQPEQNGLTVRCVITDQLRNSVTSDPAALSVLPQIVQLFIVDQPVSISASEGEEAMFSVMADGGEKPYRYQWQRMTGIDQWTDIPGADQDTYRIASVQLEQNGLTVRCVITDQLGDSVTSDPASLSVLRQPQTRSQPMLWLLWLLLAISSVAVLVAIVLYRKRSK